MKQKNIINGILLILILCCFNSCKKYLDKKSNENFSKPETLSDLQALLDNPSLNRGTQLINNMTDEYYLEYTIWNSRAKVDKESYVWDSNLNNYNDWRIIYITVFYANTVLDNLKEIKIKSPDEQIQWKNIKGQALFFRAHSFYLISQLFAPTYEANNASNKLGIPLRRNANFNEPSNRATLSDTYNQIENDLNEAITLLSNNKPSTSLYKKRPTKAACYGLLARVQLLMGNYLKAQQNASSCIQEYDVLLNYNDPSQIDTISTTNPPFKAYNQEVIFHISTTGSLNSNTGAKIDTNLYRSYDNNDLRKKVFFKKNSDPSYRFRGSYNGSLTDLFNGIAMDEIFLIRAETYARLGNKDNALEDINRLLSNRIRSSQFIPVTANSAEEVLPLIISERKKELVYRGTRWVDLRRLNITPAFQVTLTRVLNSQIFQISPNENRYTLLIPSEVINASSIQQNTR